MIFDSPPEDFEPEFDIVSCFVENNDEILLLRRQDDKPQGDTLGVPAGKIEEEDSSRKEAMKRELKEETSIDLSESELSFFDTVYVRYPSYDFIYHIFHTTVEKRSVEIRDEEHKDFGWFQPGEALDKSLVPDLGPCIELFYKDKT